MLPKDIFLQKIAAKQFREAVTDNFHNDELHSGQYRSASLCCPCAVLGLRHRRIQKCISDVFPLSYGISQAILRNVLHRLLTYTNRNNGYILRHLREAAKICHRTDCLHKFSALCCPPCRQAHKVLGIKQKFHQTFGEVH